MALKHIENAMLVCKDIEIFSTSRRIKDSRFASRVLYVKSIDEAVARGAKALVVASRSDKHYKEVEAGNRLGLDMYIEKPVVTNREQLDKVKRLQWKDSTITQCGCNLRLLPSLNKMESIIRSGTLGHIARASFTCGQWLPDWRSGDDYRRSYSAKKGQGGKVVLDLVHEIDSALWLLGEMEPLACVLSSVPELSIDSEAVALSTLRLREGGLVTVCQDYVARRVIREYQIVGSLATLTWNLSRKELVMSTPSREDAVSCGRRAFDVKGTHQAAMETFLKSCITRDPLKQDIFEGIRTAEIAIRLKELV